MNFLDREQPGSKKLIIKRFGLMGGFSIQFFLMVLSLTSWASMPVQAAFKYKKARTPLYAAIVMNDNTGEVLHTERADQKVYPASLTKMMTLYLLFEALQQKKIRLTTHLFVSSHAANQVPTKLGLKRGQKITVQDALMGIITKSANDASVAVAEHLAGSEEAFARKMTERAKKLGLHNTVFKNSSGLPDPGQVTTAREMLVLTRALYRHFPTYYRYFKFKNFIYKGQKYRNHNHLLGNCPGVDGVKTGYTAASGFNLASSARRQGVRLFAVVIGGKNRHWRDQRMQDLLNDHFDIVLANPPVSSKFKLKSSPSLVAQKTPSLKPPRTLQKAHNSLELAKNIPLSSSIQRVITPPKNPRISRGSFFEVTAADPILDQEFKDKKWSVQFGAFRSRKEAQKNGTFLKTTFKNLPGSVSIVPQRKGHRLFYCSRLTKLTKPQAEKVCQQLKLQQQDCFMLRS